MSTTAPLLDPRVRAGLTYPLGAIEPGVPVEVAPGLSVLRLAVPGPLRHVNCHLLADDDGVTVVDTGMDQPETREVWDVLPGLRVTRVIGTHFHPDHIGLAGHLCASAMPRRS